MRKMQQKTSTITIKGKSKKYVPRNDRQQNKKQQPNEQNKQNRKKRK